MRTDKNVILSILLYGLTPLITCLICGCMVGPDYKRPETLADAAESFVYADSKKADVNDVMQIGRWWERFGDSVTTELVNEALENNNDLAASAARVLQVEALFTEASGRKMPEISYNFSRSRSKQSLNFGTGRFSSLNTTFTQDISVSYIVDLFGKLKRQERSAWIDLFAAKSSQQALVHAVIANVVKARANIATIQRQLAIARSNTENWHKNLEIIERRYSRGLTGSLDVRLARENTEASKASEIVIELSLIKAQNALDVLVGRRPGTGEALVDTLSELPQLEPVPVGLPAYLLDRRPDVRAAELALESSSEQIGVSIAQMYPDLTLTGSLGRSADRWHDIWLHETEVYSTVFHLAQPIFKGGQLKARVKGAKARYAELAANYAQAVTIAIREVEDALVNEQLLQKQLLALQSRFEQAVAAEKLANERYARGVEKLIVVLETERRRRIAENELNIVKGKLWTGRVDLFLSLGGDWVGQEQSQNEKG